MYEQSPPCFDSEVLLPWVQSPVRRIPVEPKALGQGYCTANIDGVVGDRSNWSSQEVENAC